MQMSIHIMYNQAMKMNVKEESREQIRVYVISGTVICSVVFLFYKWGMILSLSAKAIVAMAPFLWGFAIAFIMVPMRRIIECKWLKNTHISDRQKRIIGVAGAIIIFALVLIGFFSVLIPQLISSLQRLASSMDGYGKVLEDYINRFSKGEEETSFVITHVYENLRKTIETWLSGENGLLSAVLSYSVGIVKNVTNFFIGVIVAIYLLLDSEKWKRQFKRVIYAISSKRFANHMVYIMRLCQKMLNNFIFGKALDSLIIGIVCGVACALMRMPYTPLIAFIIGLTNMIPVFGPFLGAVPCIFILLIINPLKALEFTIFILVLQQVDGNILGPYILGDSMGLPALWVTFAIIFGGAMAGLPGMFLGVPVFSVIYVLIRDLVSSRLKEKNIFIE